MTEAEPSQTPNGEGLQHLKRVSRIKHVILQKYLPPWAIILGSRHRQLAYFDCFAGPGEYEMEGKPVEGSPLIAVKEAIEFLRARTDQSLVMYLVDDSSSGVEFGSLSRAANSMGEPMMSFRSAHCIRS